MSRATNSMYFASWPELQSSLEQGTSENVDEVVVHQLHVL